MNLMTYVDCLQSVIKNPLHT